MNWLLCEGKDMNEVLSKRDGSIVHMSVIGPTMIYSQSKKPAMTVRSSLNIKSSVVRANPHIH